MASLQAPSGGRRTLLADSAGQIIYSGGAELPGEPLDEALAGEIANGSASFVYKDGGDGLQFGVQTITGETGWHMISLIPYANLTRELDRYFLYIMAMFVAAMAFVMLFSVSSTRRIVKPLHQLTESMVAVQNGNYDVELPVETPDEVGQLTCTYGLMLSRIRQLIDDIYATEKKKRDTELLLLQPLVENAISHGLRPMGGKGHIHIECAEIDGVLCVDVIDNGVGLPREVPEFTGYETLRGMFPASGDQTSIGLENTFTRIRLYFGERYGLLFRSRENQGTTVRVTLPIADAEKENP